MATRTIKIYGRIGESFFFEGITAQSISDQLQEAIKDDSCQHAIVAINSPGGSIAEGIAIYNEIIRINQEEPNFTVDTRNDGIAYSMGAIILMAGASVKAYRNTTMMLHNASGFAMGNAQNLRGTLQMMEAVDEGLAESIAAKSGKTAQEILNEILNYQDHTYTAQKALDNKFIDEVISEQSAEADNLQNLSVEEAFAYFSKQNEPERKNFMENIKDAVKNAFTPPQNNEPPKPQSSKPPKNNDEMKISKTLTALVALFSLTFSKEEDVKNYQPTEDDMQKLNAELEKAGQLEDVQAKLDQEKQERETLQNALPDALKEAGIEDELEGTEAIKALTAKVKEYGKLSGKIPGQGKQFDPDLESELDEDILTDIDKEARAMTNAKSL